MVRSTAVTLLSRLAIAGLTACLLCVFASSTSHAATPREQLERARQLIDEAEFEEALKLLNDELEQPGNSQETLAQLYQLQGITYLYLGQEANARRSFEKLLEANPLHELPRSSSPKVRQLFESVRADVRARQAKAVRLSHDPPKTATAGERLEIEAEIEALPAGAQAQLHFRRSGKPTWSTTRLQQKGGDDWLGIIPAFELPAEGAPYALEYYLELTDASGARLTGAGSASEPLSVRVEGAAAVVTPSEPGEEPLYAKWWFWAIAGGVVAGAATGAYFIVPAILDDTATVPVTIKVQQ